VQDTSVVSLADWGVSNDTKFYSVDFKRRDQLGDNEVDGRKYNVK
jgi:hypothetical protein